MFEKTVCASVCSVQDFTIYPMGYQIDGEIIVVCPYCFKSAVRRADDVIRFVHAIRIRRKNGAMVLDLESCPNEESSAHPPS
jgi:hypothetical protein